MSHSEREKWSDKAKTGEKETPTVSETPVKIVLFGKRAPIPHERSLEEHKASPEIVSPKSAKKEILKKLNKIKDLDGYRPSELSKRFQIPVVIIYKELEVLRKREERKQKPTSKEVNIPKQERRRGPSEERQKRWEQWVQLRAQGATDAEIGKMFWLSPGTIASEWTRMKQYGITLSPRKVGRRPNGHTQGPLPIIPRDEMILILKQDKTHREVAALLGILTESVHHYRKTLRRQGIDIPIRQPGRLPSGEARQKAKDAARLRDEGLNHAQIADKLSIEPHLVANYIYRGRKLS